ncbi:2-hydroxyhepta-2,4-diene-1,7-dioate isomerase [Sulfolobales archaeon HS-7]|nr:2-hydroxyhepta-2,4-diene-1,7-dioate isomerase [Sulfolobales archaeon HS-7]
MRWARVKVRDKVLKGEVRKGEIVTEEGEFPLTEVKFLPPVDPPFILCTLANTPEMLGFKSKEEGREALGTPKFFVKLPNTVVGHNDTVVIPKSGFRPEVEIGVIIGKSLWKPTKEQVKEAILGYTVFNDVTAPAEFKKESYYAMRRDPADGKVKRMLIRGNHFRNKNRPTFSPMGPVVVSPDEIDVFNLSMRSYVNGKIIQNGSSSSLIFSVDEVIYELSKIIELPRYTVITTGSVGYKAEEQSEFLLEPVNGEMVAEVEGIGILRNEIRVEEQ